MITDDDPNRLRQRAERYEQLAACTIDEQALQALLHLAEKDRTRADQLSARFMAGADSGWRP